MAQHRLILLVLVVASGLKVMNEPNQLTPTSLRDVVVLERLESTVASSSTPSEANLPARQLRGVFYLTPTAPGAFGSDRSEVGCIVFPRP